MSKAKPIQPPTDEQYLKATLILLKVWAPPVKKCRECKWPVIEGRCCNYCGSINP